MSSANPKLNQFLKAVATVQRNKKNKEVAQKTISTHIKKIKRLSLSPRTKKETLTREFDSFEDALRNIIRDEKTLFLKQDREEKEIEALKIKIVKLQNKLDERDERLKDMISSLTRIKSGMSQVGELRKKVQKTAREKREHAVAQKKEAKILHEQLLLLEKTYETLRKSKVHEPLALARVKRKINSLKKKLQVLKK